MYNKHAFSFYTKHKPFSLSALHSVGDLSSHAAYSNGEASASVLLCNCASPGMESSCGDSSEHGPHCCKSLEVVRVSV